MCVCMVFECMVCVCEGVYMCVGGGIYVCGVCMYISVYYVCVRCLYVYMRVCGVCLWVRFVSMYMYEPCIRMCCDVCT